MATKIVSRADGTVISRNGKRENNDEEKVNNRLAQAAYTAVTPAQPIVSGVTGAGNAGYTIAAGSTVGRPTNFAGGDAAYSAYLQNEPAIKAANIAYNTGSGGRFDQIASGYDPGGRASPAGREIVGSVPMVNPAGVPMVSNPSNTGYAPANTGYAPATAVNGQNALVGTPYASAYQSSVNANNEALNASIAAIQGQAPKINRQYEDLAKQAYASYVKGGAVLPYQTQDIATGARDNLALQQQLGYENTRTGISQNKADALLALESQVAQARATGATNLAELEWQYANLQAQLLKESQDMAYDQQWRMDERAYNQMVQDDQRTWEQNMQKQKMDFDQRLAMEKAQASSAKTIKTALAKKDITYSEMKYYDKLYQEDGITEEEYQLLRDAYFSKKGITSQPAEVAFTPYEQSKVFVEGLGNVFVNDLYRLVESDDVIGTMQNGKMVYKVTPQYLRRAQNFE